MEGGGGDVGPTLLSWEESGAFCGSGPHLALSDFHFFQRIDVCLLRSG